MNFKVLGDSDKPIKNAVVSLMSAWLAAPYFQAMTDASGNVILPNNVADGHIISAFVPSVHKGGAAFVSLANGVLSPDFIKLDGLFTGAGLPALTRPFTGFVHWQFVPSPVVGVRVDLVTPTGVIQATNYTRSSPTGCFECSLPVDPTGWKFRVTMAVAGFPPVDAATYGPVDFEVTQQMSDSLAGVLIMAPAIPVLVQWPPMLDLITPDFIPTLGGLSFVAAPPL